MTQFKAKNTHSARSITMRCPACRSRIKTYGATRAMSDHVEHRYMRCANPMCNASYEVQVAIIREVQPPAQHEEPSE